MSKLTLYVMIDGTIVVGRDDGRSNELKGFFLREPLVLERRSIQGAVGIVFARANEFAAELDKPLLFSDAVVVTHYEPSKNLQEYYEISLEYLRDHADESFDKSVGVVNETMRKLLDELNKPEPTTEELREQEAEESTEEKKLPPVRLRRKDIANLMPYDGVKN